MRVSDRSWSRTILRLSGRSPEPAPEKKSGEMTAAAVFRRFFSVLTQLQRRGTDKDSRGRSP
jgi:hypothetical protein